MRFHVFVLIAACAIAITACSPSPQPAGTASPSPVPSPAASSPPAPTPTGQPTPLALPPEAPPQILAIELSDPVFHGGETVSGTVVTSTNVAAVDVEVAGRGHRLPRTAPGIFSMSYTLPKIPFFLRGTYTAHVTAQNSAGLTAERDVTVSLR